MITQEKIEGGTTLLIDKESNVIAAIDPTSPLDEVARYLEKSKLEKASWVGILLTRGDLNHAARAAEMSARWNVPVFGHKKMMISLQRLPAEAQKAGLCGVKVPQISKFVKPGDKISFGRGSIRVESVEEILNYVINDRV